VGAFDSFTFTVGGTAGMKLWSGLLAAWLLVAAPGSAQEYHGPWNKDVADARFNSFVRTFDFHYLHRNEHNPDLAWFKGQDSVRVSNFAEEIHEDKHQRVNYRQAALYLNIMINTRQNHEILEGALRDKSAHNAYTAFAQRLESHLKNKIPAPRPEFYKFSKDEAQFHLEAFLRAFDYNHLEVNRGRPQVAWFGKQHPGHTRSFLREIIDQPKNSWNHRKVAFFLFFEHYREEAQWITGIITQEDRYSYMRGFAERVSHMHDARPAVPVYSAPAPAQPPTYHSTALDQPTAPVITGEKQTVAGAVVYPQGPNEGPSTRAVNRYTEKPVSTPVPVASEPKTPPAPARDPYAEQPWTGGKVSPEPPPYAPPPPPVPPPPAGEWVPLD
jgi:hypothetical protein